MMRKIVVVLVALGILAWLTVVRAQDETFTYNPPGSIQPKTGAEVELSTGYVDYEVHAPGIGFPLILPAFANSQVYRPGGSGYVGPVKEGQCYSGNYSFPWRDDYCESRLGSNRINEVCPGGFGHQGQDIRPRTCVIDWHEVLAVEDGYVFEGGDKNDPDKPIVGELLIMTYNKERLYDYLHMETVRYKIDSRGKQVLDGNGKPIEEPGTRLTFKKDDPIKRGQTIGYVSSILGGLKDNTTRHLHFALRRQKKDAQGKFLKGRKYFYHSPYMSLVRAYEAALGQTGTMLPAPVICTANTTRCTTKSIITCNNDGTAEVLTPCATVQCKGDAACHGGATPPPPPVDMAKSLPPDLSTVCQPASCTCGCQGNQCKPQLCTPGIAYCSGNTVITCPNRGCEGTSALVCPSGYTCSSGNCYITPPADMSTSPPPDLAVSKIDMSGPPKTEVCNGLDDDGNGIIDDPTSCWQWITRFKDPITGARCYGVGTTAPFACAAYDREFTLFAVPTVAWGDGSNTEWVQCSRGIDHILTKKGGTERASLEAMGWNCFLSLGYFFDQGRGPRLPKRTPYATTCSLYRQRFAVAGSQSHFFTPFAESTAGAVCESPARADVVSITGCSIPPGC